VYVTLSTEPHINYVVELWKGLCIRAYPAVADTLGSFDSDEPVSWRSEFLVRALQEPDRPDLLYAKRVCSAFKGSRSTTFRRGCKPDTKSATRGRRTEAQAPGQDHRPFTPAEANPTWLVKWPPTSQNTFRENSSRSLEISEECSSLSRCSTTQHKVESAQTWVFRCSTIPSVQNGLCSSHHCHRSYIDSSFSLTFAIDQQTCSPRKSPFTEGV